MLDHDLDIMRDVYMTVAQRDAYSRIVARATLSEAVGDAPAHYGVRPATPEEEAEVDAAAGLVRLTLRIPVGTMAVIDARARQEAIIRPAMIRRLLDRGLAFDEEMTARCFAAVAQARRVRRMFGVLVALSMAALIYGVWLVGPAP
jgi:hypothetical protein